MSHIRGIVFFIFFPVIIQCIMTGKKIRHTETARYMNLVLYFFGHLHKIRETRDYTREYQIQQYLHITMES